MRCISNYTLNLRFQSFWERIWLSWQLELSSMCILYNLKFYHCLLVSLPIGCKIFSCESSLSIMYCPRCWGCNIKKEQQQQKWIPTQMLLSTLEYSWTRILTRWLKIIWHWFMCEYLPILLFFIKQHCAQVFWHAER